MDGKEVMNREILCSEKEGIEAQKQLESLLIQ